MSSFKEDIAIATDEEKKQVYVNILANIINSHKFLTKQDVMLLFEKQIKEKLSEDEFTAIYNLSIEVKKSFIDFKDDEKLLDFLNISEYCKNDNGNLLKMIKTIVKDIEINRKKTVKTPWYLQLRKIFKRMEGNDLQEDIEEKDIREENKELNNIIYFDK